MSVVNFFARVWHADVLGPFDTREDAREALIFHVPSARRVQWVSSDDERSVELANDLEGELLGEVWPKGHAPPRRACLAQRR